MRLYKELLENDSRGEEITARATDKDLKELFVRPEWYGAKGDGVHDDTAAIQAAIDSIDERGDVVFSPGKNYLVTSTIIRKSGVRLISGGGWRLGNGSDAVSQITFTPSIIGDNLFEIAPIGASYTEGADIIGLIIIGNADSGCAIYDNYPRSTNYRGLYITTFEDGISILGSMELNIDDCYVRYCDNTPLRIRGNYSVTVSTTTRIRGCNFRESPWGAILEVDAGLGLSFKNTIFESNTAGGIDIYQGNREICLIDCYSENNPTTAIAGPLIQIGVNGVSERAQYARSSVFVIGGSWSGTNGGAWHADSCFIKSDDAFMISVVGAHFGRMGKMAITTAKTQKLCMFGNSAVQVTDFTAGLYTEYQLVGELPISSTQGLLGGSLQANKIKAISSTGKWWELWSAYSTTDPDLFFNCNGVEFLRMDALGRIRQQLAASPPAAVADCYQLYAANYGGANGKACPHIKAEDGTVVRLNQDISSSSTPTFCGAVISGPSVTGNWATNGGFDSDASGWSATRCALASVSGGQAGNCLEMTYTSGPTNSAASQVITGLLSGRTYTISAYIKSGTSGNEAYAITVYDEGGTIPIYNSGGTSSGSWVEKTGAFVNTAGNSTITAYIIKNSTTAGTMLFDTVGITMDSPVVPADGSVLYTDDITAGNAAPHFRTEAGDIVKLYKVVDERADDVANSGDATTDGLIDALRDAMIQHGLIAAA
jgi:hypothetical protein